MPVSLPNKRTVTIGNTSSTYLSSIRLTGFTSSTFTAQVYFWASGGSYTARFRAMCCGY